MKTSEFEYQLPHELIAQHPLAERDASRLMFVDRGVQSLTHHRFRKLPSLLRAGDLLVLNDAKVLPARLWATKTETGAEIELLLLEELGTNHWRSMARPAKKLKTGTSLGFDHANLTAVVLEKREDGTVELEFKGVTNVRAALPEVGEPPLPPYIERAPRSRSAEDRERYQTVYARREGAVAAPTAGLHFTKAVFDALAAKGIETCFVTLEVGPGTFLPVKVENVEDHAMHEERYEISQATADKINAAKGSGRRVVAVGTTSLRVLESVAQSPIRPLSQSRGTTKLFIHPPYEFKIADGLLTNFHLPRSTLLMLVSAFAGMELTREAYAEAIREKYRFYSYGDCMLIV